MGNTQEQISLPQERQRNDKSGECTRIGYELKAKS